MGIVIQQTLDCFQYRSRQSLSHAFVFVKVTGVYVVFIGVFFSYFTDYAGRNAFSVAFPKYPQNHVIYCLYAVYLQLAFSSGLNL